MPRFSIVMPTFRREHVIRRTIGTIQEQTFSDWELIVVDNHGSNYRFDDPRIKSLLYVEEAGAGRARNYGLRFLNGELACFFDDDDIMCPHYLETFDKVFQDPRVMMARCGMLTGSDGTIENFSFATPEVMTRSTYLRPTWDDADCHDQRYFQDIVSQNGWSGDQIVEIRQILVKAMTDPSGGLRDPDGRF
jgi:glycosyltransferase involved in cell wall biosynthesis